MTFREKTILLIILSILVFNFKITPQSYKLLQSDENHSIIEFNFEGKYKLNDTTIGEKVFHYISGEGMDARKPGEPWLPEIFVHLGIPFGAAPSINILNISEIEYKNIFIIPTPKEDPSYASVDLKNMDKNIYYSDKFFPEENSKLYPTYVLRYSKIQPIGISPFRFNPLSRMLTAIKTIKLEIKYNNLNNTLKFQKVDDAFTLSSIKNFILNFEFAKNWLSQDFSEKDSVILNYWYNPNKNYYKIYLNKEGIYRITYNQLINAGVPIGSGIPSKKLEIFNEGEAVPIDVFDGGDSTFNSGDYFQFVGKPAKPTIYCTQNIYNRNNVYWFSYEADSIGLRFKERDAYPYLPHYYYTTYTNSIKIDHYEEDEIYEPLGYAPNAQRDFWFWGRASGTGGIPSIRFIKGFTTFNGFNLQSPIVKLKIGLHGMTNPNIYCNYDHNAQVFVNEKFIDKALWNDQEAFILNTRFYVAEDSVQIFPTGNSIKIIADGNVCGADSINSDEFRINWFEFEYFRDNAVDTNFFYLTTPSSAVGRNRYWLFRYKPTNITIYNMVKKEKLINVQFDTSYGGGVLFADSTIVQTTFFCGDNNHYYAPDSIKKDYSSNLRAITNGADLIVITHSSLIEIANRYRNIRESNFPDTSISNPRIKIIDVQDIYDEFSNGMLEPNSLNSFIKYAFQHWNNPAPVYVTLIGDMSHDYRGLLQNSRKNFIPSISYKSYEYGQAPSDNGIVTVAGEDLVPDLIIGRISVETVVEGNVYLDKVATYPQDNFKKWKENVLLMASGIDAGDESLFGFNDASLSLYNTYLLPYGYDSKMIFRFPNKSTHVPYKGSTLEIRKAFNDGCVVANYYGHGGGYQWDLTFLNNDIYLLNNLGRYPLILSVTCYTAHFDNQDVFGEQFIKVPNKGSLAFVGSSGLTNWLVGLTINSLIFDEIFAKKNYISGSSFYKSKTRLGSSIGIFGDQLALMSFLGDPLVKLALPTLPDFMVQSSDITVTPENPIVGDNSLIKIKFNNVGIKSVEDSVYVEVLFSSQDTSGVIEKRKIKNFGNKDSLILDWKPKKSGLFQISVKINLFESINEADYSDNTALISIPVYNISDPNIISPSDGNVDINNFINIKVTDIGEYINRNLEYYFEIDTSLSFSSSFKSPKLLPVNGMIDWNSPSLTKGEYFFRSRIFDGLNFGKWSDTRGFTLGDLPRQGFYYSKKLLQLFDLDNVNFSQTGQNLFLNTSMLPPKPMYQTMVDSFRYAFPGQDSIPSTCITSDGKYIYVACLYVFIPESDTLRRTKIYKFGTGFNGTIKGQYYGTVPNFFHQVKSTIFYHSDGFLYATIGLPNKLLRVNLTTSNIDSIEVSEGFIEIDSAKIKQGQIHACSDGQYVYNIAYSDSLGNPRFSLQVFDPSQNWKKINRNYYPNINVNKLTSNFFVADGYFYSHEIFASGFMSRVRISDGFYYPEWFTWAKDGLHPKIRFYAWNYDWINNLVYATTYVKPDLDTINNQIIVFKGKYVDSRGSIFTQQIGPAKKWNSLTYQIENLTSSNKYFVSLYGLNNSTKLWDTLIVNAQNNQNLSGINPSTYSFVKAGIVFVDSSFTTINPLTLKNIGIDYQEPPELLITRKDLSFSLDSLMQGFKLGMQLKVTNIGKVSSDTFNIKFMLDGSDSVFAIKTLTLEKDSSTSVTDTIDTSPFVFDHRVQALIDYKGTELFKFNNITKNSFYVSRDSTNPKIKVTFDGKEIINGDIVSKNPEIKISLLDNSPLPLDTSFFTLIFDNVPMGFTKNKLEYNISPYPNSNLTITWKPTLTKGRHTLDILAKDGSGNFFDTTFFRIIFYVYEENDLANVYNYPNPFKEDTYFTFELRGKQKPRRIAFRIFTVAGRLIREFEVPNSDFQVGFNRIYWDGKDQDNDPIANGLYFYKLIVNFSDKTKIETKKLVKLK
jgi:hypothetical protein